MSNFINDINKLAKPNLTHKNLMCFIYKFDDCTEGLSNLKVIDLTKRLYSDLCSGFKVTPTEVFLTELKEIVSKAESLEFLRDELSRLVYKCIVMNYYVRFNQTVINS